MKNIRTKRAAKQDIAFTYAPMREIQPKAAPPADEQIFFRVEAVRALDISPNQPARER